MTFYPLNRYSYSCTRHLDLLLVCSVSWWLHSCCHGNSNQGNAITKQVVPLPAAPLTLKHLNQHHVQLEALQTHPGEGRQKQEVKESRNHSAQNLYKEFKRAPELHYCFFKLINFFFKVSSFYANILLLELTLNKSIRRSFPHFVYYVGLYCVFTFSVAGG